MIVVIDLFQISKINSIKYQEIKNYCTEIF